MKPTVILTRGLEDSTRLAKRLAAHGYSAFKKPLLEIQPVPAAELPPLPALTETDWVIFVSGNAVRFGLAPIRHAAPNMPQCAAVGRRTAALLRDAGIAPLVPTREDSEGLLDTQPLREVSGRRVILVKGYGGRDLLANTLVQRGAEVIEFNCYRRYYRSLSEADVRSEIAPRKPLVWVVSSGEMVQHLGEQVAQSGSPELQAQALVVPSVRVALQASSNGWSHVLTASDASDTAVIELLEEHYG